MKAAEAAPMPPERRAWEPDPLFSGQLFMPGAAPRRMKAAEAAPMPPERRAWEPDPLFSGQSHWGIALLLVAFLVVGGIYGVITPIFEAPDESEHFFYVVHLARGGGLPVQPPAGPGGLWQQEGGQPPLYYALAALLVAPLDTSAASALRWENSYANLGNPLHPANKNRFVHTDAEAWPYRGALLALHLARWLSLLMGAGTVYLIYRIVGDLWPARRDLALATAALTAFTPQFIFISSAVTNDNLITLLSTLMAWLLVRRWGAGVHWSRGFSRLGRQRQRPAKASTPDWRGAILRVDNLVLGLILGLAALTKLSGLVLWPLAGLFLLLANGRRQLWRRTLAELSLVFGVALALSGWWYVRNWQLYGDPTGLGPFLAIVGRRDQPLSLLNLARQFEGLRISYWALFGWFNLLLPAWVYRVFDGFTLVALLGLGWGWLNNRRRQAPGASGSAWRLGRYLLPLAWIVAFLISMVRWTLLTPGTQGRLLFPAAWAISLLLMLGWSGWLPGSAHIAPAAAAAERRAGLEASAGLIVNDRNRLKPRIRRAAIFRARVLAYRSSFWLAAPLVLLAALAIAAPFAVIRPAYTRPALIAADAVPAAARLTPVQHGDSARCIGGALDPATARPGDTVWATIYWEAVQPFDRDDTVFVHLTDRQGRSVAEANGWPGLGSYPTRLWQPGAVIVDRHPVLIPADATAPALLRADVGLFVPGDKGEPARLPDGQATMNVIGTVRLLPRQIVPARPAHPLTVSLEDGIALLGYDLAPAGAVAPGQAITLTLHWQATRRPAADYAVFVHLRRADNSNLTQADAAPRGGDWPTAAWEPGQPVADPHVLTMPAGTPPGVYTLWIGMYRPVEMTRLTLSAAGARISDNALYLGDVVVR
jgi:4-amino-4-deoxy-L-arabinose transferase-like glycosyltransferase